MSEVTPTQAEEAKANPTDGGENEDEKEFDNLFADDIDFDDEEKTPEELKAEFQAYKEEKKKELAKFYSKKGMELSKKKEEVVTPKEVPVNDLEVIFFESKPEAESVKDDLAQVAKAKGITLIQAWKQESWLQEKAKALYAEKTETEENKGRVGSPSAIPAKGMTEVQRIAQRLSDNLPRGFSADKPKLS